MIALTIDGKPHTFEGDPAMPLIWFLRDVLNLTHIKHDCLIATCGHCAVKVGTTSAFACVVPVSELNGASIVTSSLVLT